FAAVGVGFGIAGYTAMRWAQVQFVSAAGGADPGRFGPVLLAVVYFATTVSFMVAGPLLAGILGAMAGSQFRAPTDGALVGGGGGLAGYVALIVLGLGATSLFGGPGTEQLYTFGSAVGPLALAAVATAVVGAGAGALGAWAGG
ncbi:MAG: hypothetical protein ABEJ28_01555, partial [Salinigranum sp.]